MMTNQSFKLVTAYLFFALALSGCGGSEVGNKTVADVIDPVNTISVDLNSDQLILDANQSTTVYWKSTGVDSCVASGAWSGNIPTEGSATVGPFNDTQTLTISCSGTDGSVSDSILVTVNQAAVNVPTLTFTSSPDSVAYLGSSTLNWSATNVSDCNASGAWAGSKGLTGSEQLQSLTQTGSYTLNCSGANGSVSRTVNVVVASALAPTVDIQVSSDAVVNNGSATISWSSTLASSCIASGSWSGVKALSGSTTINNIQQNGNYILTCSGDGGSAVASATISVLPTVTFSASDISVAMNGSTTLSWSSTNASSCIASGSWSGVKALSGSTTVNNIQQNGNYILTCSGDGGSAEASATISVLPTVTFSASDISVPMNGSTTLSWSSTNASSCVATGDWSGNLPASGAQTIDSITQDSVFNLSCSGAGGTANDSLGVTVQTTTNGTALLSWTPPTSNTDNTALTDLSGYKIYYGTAPGNYTESIVINNPGLSSYMVENLTSATWYFVMTAFNSSNIESGYSTEASKTIN